MRQKNFIILFVIFYILLGIGNIVYGKYISNDTFTVAKINIESTPPQIKFEDLTNSNKGYEEYANKTHIINLKLKVIENNIKTNNFNKDYIEILVGNKLTKISGLEIKEVERKEDYIIYNLKITGIEGNGGLGVRIKQGAIIDKAGNQNKSISFLLNITIDNISPTATTKEQKLTNGKSKVVISANELLRPSTGWTISSDKKSLTKEFPANTNYNLPITDYAGNVGSANVSVENATYIYLDFGLVSVKERQSSLYEINKKCIVGEENLKNNPLCKAEIITFSKKGQIADDFIGIQAYCYTYWGAGSKAVSISFENTFPYGYNPSSTVYGSLKDGPKVMLNGTISVALGGDRSK